MKRMLIVEDDENLSRGMAFAFEKDGCTVVTANSLTTGLAGFERGKADIVINA